MNRKRRNLTFYSLRSNNSQNLWRMRMKSTLLCVFNFSRERNESETFKMVTDLERHAKRLIEANTKERIENEKKITYALSHQVD